MTARLRSKQFQFKANASVFFEGVLFVLTQRSSGLGFLENALANNSSERYLYVSV